jgi:hypothetical protein
MDRNRANHITFYGDDLIKGNWLFRAFVLKPDIRNGIHFYEKEKVKFLNSAMI